MTREEHLEWCKQRAREYLNRGDGSNAVASMLSDLGKHAETEGAGKNMAMLGIVLLTQPNPLEEARRFVEGFR